MPIKTSTSNVLGMGNASLSQRKRAAQKQISRAQKMARLKYQKKLEVYLKFLRSC